MRRPLTLLRGAVTEPLVRATDLTKTYMLAGTRIAALAGVSLEVHAVEAIAITGPSGSGKTTLLNLIGGLDRPSSGDIVVADRVLRRLDARGLAEYRRSTIGFVFQSFRLLPYLDAVENVALPLLIAGGTRTTAACRARALLDRVGLGARGRHRPAELSAGEQQRVAVARAIANHPSLLLADEPTGNLDESAATALLDLFDELREQEGLTVLVATHNADVAARASRVVRLRGGRLVLESVPS